MKNYLPAILLTGFAFDAENRPDSIDYVLKKPLVREELRGALRSLVGRPAATPVNHLVAIHPAER